MTVELVSNVGHRSLTMSLRAFGKLLHIAQVNGWHPTKFTPAPRSEEWDTKIILPGFGSYLPGTVSKEDAHGLLRALTRANATGATATDRTLLFPVTGLLELARMGSFGARLALSESGFASESAYATVA